MDQHQQQISQYITSRLQAGATLDAIRNELLSVGWPAGVIDGVLNGLHTPSIPAPGPELPAVDLNVNNHPGSASNIEHTQIQSQPYQPYSPNTSGTLSEPVQGAAQPTAMGMENQQTPIQPGNAGAISEGQYDTPGGTAGNSTQLLSDHHFQGDANTPQKYKVFRSIADGFGAMKNNFPAYLSAAVSSFLLVGAALTFAAVILVAIGSKFFMMGALTNMGLSLAFSLGTFAVVLAVLYGLADAFMTAAVSYPLMSGAEHKQDNVLAVLLHALKRTPKLILANFVVYVISMGPLLLVMVALVGLALVLRSSSAGLVLLIFGFVAYIVGLAWAIVAWLRFALTPYVVLFEENLSIRQALSRSHQLLRHGGKWFLIKGAILIFILALIFAAFGHKNVESLQADNSLVTNIISAALLLFVNNSLVMLYRNRRIVRGNQP